MSKKKLSSYMLYKLGLPPDADDSTVLGAVDRLQEDKRKAEEELLAHAQVEARAKAEAAKKKKIEEGEPDLPTLVVKAVADATETERTRADSERRLNDLTGMKTYGESLGVVLLWKESVVEAERLRARIAELEQKGHGATAEALVEQGIRENKISPAQREYWLAIGKKDPEMLRGYLKSASTVVPKKTAVQPDVKPMVAITEEQKRVAAKLGITDPKALEKISEQMAETQALRAGAA